MMPKPLPPETPTSPVALVAAAAAFALSACSHVPASPTPVRVPVDIKDNTTIGSARLSWHDAPETTRAGSFTPGMEIEYDQGIGRSNQHLGANEFIQLDGKTLSGPQDLRHRADLRYGHLAFDGIWRFPGRASGLELEWVAGLGQAQLGLRSESRSLAVDPLVAKYSLAGVVLGVGPRWNFTDTLALEARVQALSSSPSSDDRFWYREIAVRYRPVKNVAIRMGYSEMDYRPANLSDGDSPVHVRMYGPFLGLDFPF
jgi:hypothetical protein